MRLSLAAAALGVKDKRAGRLLPVRVVADVIGCDPAGFFERNTETLRAEVDQVFRALLAPDGQ